MIVRLEEVELRKTQADPSLVLALRCPNILSCSGIWALVGGLSWVGDGLVEYLDLFVKYSCLIQVCFVQIRTLCLPNCLQKFTQMRLAFTKKKEKTTR